MVSMIVLCTHNDGGVGKTTLAVHIAGALQTQLVRLLLIDCDDQADFWQFYSDRLPQQNKDIFISEDISIIWNRKREAVRRLAKLEQYDHIVLDMDSALQNSVEMILGSQPDLIFVPINRSQKVKALRNLPRTLTVVAQLGEKIGYTPRTIVVPLGIDAAEIEPIRQKPELNGFSWKTAPAIPDLQDLMQIAIYQDKKYIWQYPGQAHLLDYFLKLLGDETNE
ncbi:ParA family protein [Alkalinema pantanalense CENA528]|uniref:ParA family protein n=1 Tax=Alkalinema pantanalense TaxID=1620705 RepID=UPI003D7008C3